MTFVSNLEEVLTSKFLEDSAVSSSVIFDLTESNRFVIYPNFSTHKMCNCSSVNSEVEIIEHCFKCGASYLNLDSGLPTYDLYNCIYKAMDILSKRVHTISILSNTYIPLDFVGSLNRNNYTYLDLLPHRRNIMLISNAIVHTDDFFVKAELATSTRDKLTHLAIFSSVKGVLEHHKAKIIHSTVMTPLDYTNFLLSSAGVNLNYVIS